MPKNRDYTGLLRTPPSLAWLIREKAKARGRLERLEKALASLPDEIEQAKVEIAALDAVIPRHRVKVDPQIIQGVRAKKPPLLPYGALTRRILEMLRLNGKPVYSTEIALFVARAEGVDLDDISKGRLVKIVCHRLRALVSAGVVVRHHELSSGARDEGLWSLSPSEAD